MFSASRAHRLLVSVAVSLLFLLAHRALPGQEIPSVLVTTVKGVRMDVSGDGLFSQDFRLETPVSLEGVSRVHWERLWFQIRREAVPGGAYYGSGVSVELLSGGEPVTGEPNTFAMVYMDIPSQAVMLRGGWGVQGAPPVTVDGIRFSIITPVDFSAWGIVTTGGSGATLELLGEDDTLTLRFVIGEFGPDGPNIVRSVPGIQERTASGAPGPWSTHLFDARVPTEGLRFIDHDWFGFRGGIGGGGMVESQLLLEDHTDESPSVIALDDAYSPSRGEPRPGECTHTNCRELSPEDLEEIGGREIIGWRWRPNVLPGCSMTLVPNFFVSPMQVRFAYEFGALYCLPAPAIEVADLEGTAPFHLTARAVESDVPPGVAATYSWDFGDGTAAEGPEADHVYSRAGRYVLRLTRRADCGLPRTARRRVRVDGPSGDVSPWTSSPIGEPEMTGGAAAAGDGCLRVSAGGRFLTTRSERDECHFVHQELRGDGAIEARLAAADAPATGAQFGLMVRESLDPASRDAAIVVTLAPTSLAARLQRNFRTALVRRLASIRSPAGWSWPDPPLWLRLERRGSRIEAFLRLEGGEWTSGGIVDFEEEGGAPLAESLLYGIVAVGHDPQPGAPFAALDLTVCDAAVAAAPWPRAIRADCNGDADTGGVTDAVFLLGYSFLGGDVPPCLAACDANGDGSLAGVTDAVYLLSFNFLGGPPPPAPFPDCGPLSRETDAALGCLETPETCR